VTYCFLCLGEIALRTKRNHQLPGYAKKYLGKSAQWILFFAIIFGIYSALLAYLIGEGRSFSVIFTGVDDYAIYFALGFWFLMGFMQKEGLRGLKKVELWGVLVILFLIFSIALIYLPDVEMKNIAPMNFGSFFFPFGVILFALMGFTSIPEMEMEIKGDEKKLKKVIVIGVLIPIVVYALFSFVLVGVQGGNVPEVATLGFNKLVVVLGIFTMLTSYFVLSFSLKDIYRLDLKLSKDKTFYLTVLAPLIIYLVLYYFNQLNFVNVLGLGGVISGGLSGILILLMCKSAKVNGDREPEFSVPINWFVIGLISLIFIGGIVVELVF